MDDGAIMVNPWMILPFGILLATIALAPLFFQSWWLKHYPKVACSLALITLCYYLFALKAYGLVWHTTHEYISFIALIGSLYIVSGGIHINVKGEATPFANVIFLLIGAVIANFLGTTGASMLLIRPWLRMNKYRITAHHVVFFIFIVSNVGGCLTPIADPPLFLGYLMGIPFWWVAEHCIAMWLVGVSVLLVFFFIVDYRNYLRAPRQVRDELTAKEEWRFEGLGNIFFLAIILVSVFVNNLPFLREGMMAAAAAGSYFTTRKQIHESNHFDFHPIQEVAILFIGIFATMMPALDWLQANSSQLKSVSPALFYWSAGALSSMLDNAPTYVCFLKTIFGRFVDPDVVSQLHQLIQTHGADLANVTGAHAEEIKQTYLALQKYHASELASGNVGLDEIKVAYLVGNYKLNGYLLAISIAAVFFGANTYIGNGPNFMVKSIADQQKVHTPSFLSYIFKFAVPYVLPMLLIVWWLFFRH
jgi:Na+/H+ antiporter NhaD/arsenite permease-like protein